MELNVGAYVVHTDVLYPMLERLQPSPMDGEYRLTDCVHALIRSRNRVESYRIYDEGEVQGVNTPQDLERAEFILQKRFFRPRRVEEESLIQLWHRRLAGGDLGRLYHAQRAPPVAGAGQQDHPRRTREARAC